MASEHGKFRDIILDISYLRKPLRQAINVLDSLRISKRQRIGAQTNDIAEVLVKLQILGMCLLPRHAEEPPPVGEGGVSRRRILVETIVEVVSRVLYHKDQENDPGQDICPACRKKHGEILEDR